MKYRKTMYFQNFSTLPSGFTLKPDHFPEFYLKAIQVSPEIWIKNSPKSLKIIDTTTKISITLFQPWICPVICIRKITTLVAAVDRVRPLKEGHGTCNPQTSWIGVWIRSPIM
jgi:hypothetical protein